MVDLDKPSIGFLPGQRILDFIFYPQPIIGNTLNFEFQNAVLISMVVGANSNNGDLAAARSLLLQHVSFKAMYFYNRSDNISTS